MCVVINTQALEDEDVLVKTAAINSLRKTTIQNDARVLKGLVDTALYDSEWQVCGCGCGVGVGVGVGVGG